MNFLKFTPCTLIWRYFFPEPWPLKFFLNPESKNCSGTLTFKLSIKFKELFKIYTLYFNLSLFFSEPWPFKVFLNPESIFFRNLDLLKFLQILIKNFSGTLLLKIVLEPWLLKFLQILIKIFPEPWPLKFFWNPDH